MTACSLSKGKLLQHNVLGNVPELRQCSFFWGLLFRIISRCYPFGLNTLHYREERRKALPPFLFGALPQDLPCKPCHRTLDLLARKRESNIMRLIRSKQKQYRTPHHVWSRRAARKEH